MGTPRKQRRKYTRPAHPWQMERITAEREICVKFGLKNKTELWKAQSRLARIRDGAKKLLAQKGEKADIQRKALLDKMRNWGVKVESIDDILALDVSAILERRLESVVFRKGMASTPKQARQYIVHNHIYVGTHKVTIPSYIVLAKEEDTVRVVDELQKVQESAREEVKEAG
ncbi:MAG: 30S ribosomal protein S4 [Candidatus Altiarchaeota archaeon]